MRAQSRWPEALVLVAGGLSAAGLGWAALRSWGDPELLARVELERGSERAVQLLRLAWEQQAAAPAAPGGGEVVGARLDDLDTPERPAPVDRERPGPSPHAFDALLTDAETARDREALVQALAEHPNAPRRAEGWLRLIQLSVADGDPAAAREAWSAARAELVPHDARRDVAYVLLDALAAAPALNDDERASAQNRLAAQWTAGLLALPTPVDRWIDGDCVFDSRVEVLALALEQLSPRHAGAARLAADRDGRRVRALLVHLDGPELPAADGRWHGLTELDWLARVGAGGELDLVPYDPQALNEAIALAAAPGEGFGLAGEGEATGETVTIAGREWPLLHPGLDELVADASARQRNLRQGFGLLLLLSLVAVGLTYAALVRRRRLEALKSRFVAGVSHDLRTPLASILLMAENLESGRVTDEGRRAQYHSSIRREATRLRRLVDDVLDFSRLERGEGSKLAREEVELARVFDGLEQECRERVERAGGSLTVTRTDLPGLALLDPEALRRAVGNLIDNALTHSGSTELELLARGAGDQLVVEVSDGGRGVPVARREALFRAFQQGASSNGAAGGTGLGLAIVRELARAHGGDAVFVDQAVGARVRLTFPLDSPENDA